MTIYYLVKEDNKIYVDLLIDLFPSNIIIKSNFKGIDKDNDKVIIQSINFLKPLLFMKFKYIYYFNIEQMSIYMDYLNARKNNKELSFIPNRVVKNILTPYFKLDKEYYDKGNYKLLDYSKENTLIWKNEFNRNIIGIIEPYFPLQKHISTYDKNYPFISLINHDYRPIFIYKYLPSIKSQIHNFLGLFGNDRRSLLKKSKIMINIHSGYNFRIGELFRINEAIAHKVIVISQNCYCNELLTLSDYIIFSDDNKIETICKDVLENYNYYYSKFYEGESLSRLELLISKIKKQNENILYNL